MIRAEFEDYQRALRKKWDNKDYFIYEIQLENLFNWKKSTLKIEYPICLLTGVNGSGKSTLINSLKHINSIQKKESSSVIFSQISNYTIKLLDKEKKEITSKDNTLLKEEFIIPTIYDITFDTKLYSYYKTSSSDDKQKFLEALEAFDSDSLPQESLSLLREITRKDIISASRTIDTEDNREYYNIELRDKTKYDSYTMGSGEFYANQLLWKLKELPPKSIVLIEELENFVHCEAQKKILEILYKCSVQEGVQFILTTHSPTLIEHSVEESRVLVKLGSENNVICLNKCSNWLARDHLGYENSEKIEVIVEDEKAKKVLETFFSLRDPEIYSLLLVNPVGSDSLIDRICTDCVSKLKIKNLIGILDGDSSFDTDETKNLIKLPGSESPEEIVLKIISENTAEIAQQLQTDEEKIKVILTNAMLISDSHEWVTEISTKLGINNDFLWELFVRMWYQKEKDKGEMENFYSTFKKIFVKLNIK